MLVKGKLPDMDEIIEEPELKFELPNEPEKISDIICKIKEFLRVNGCEDQELNFRVELCGRELMANALEHGCKGKPAGISRVDVSLNNNINQIKITVNDPGPGFNYKELKLQKMPLLEEKGRGLPLVFATADALEFKNNGTSVTIRIDIDE